MEGCNANTASCRNLHSADRRQLASHVPAATAVGTHPAVPLLPSSDSGGMHAKPSTASPTSAHHVGGHGAHLRTATGAHLRTAAEPRPPSGPTDTTSGGANGADERAADRDTASSGRADCSAVRCHVVVLDCRATMSDTLGVEESRAMTLQLHEMVRARAAQVGLSAKRQAAGF